MSAQTEDEEHTAQLGDHVMDLVTGRWRSQALYSGVELGVFEVVGDRPRHADEIADQMNVDREKGYRLLRALSSLELLDDLEGRRFSITPAGALLQEDHPGSLRGVALLEEGPTHYATWKHLSDIVRDGDPNGFRREFGRELFEHTAADSEYGQVFNEAMSSYSQMESAMVADLLDGIDFSSFDQVCDVGGGHGHLLCTLIQEAPAVEGAVLERPNVVEDEARHCHEALGLGDRVRFVAGDFFKDALAADAYLLKHILHDWDDAECVEILSTIRDAAPGKARLFNCEFVVPGPEQSHLAKLFDIHMMVTTGGRERTESEYVELYEEAGFEHVETHRSDEVPMATVEGRVV